MVRNSTKQEQKSSNGKATAHLLQLLGGGNLGSRWSTLLQELMMRFLELE